MSAVLVFVLAVASLVALIWVLQRSLIYIPSQAVPQVEAVFPHGEQVFFETDDGLELGAWFVPSSIDDGGATVVVFNGNAGNRSNRVVLAGSLSQRGYGVLLADYRGYGGNPGRPTEAGLAKDAVAAVRYLETRSDVDPDRLVYFGESLGAAVALRLATDRPPAVLVLRSPFTSLADVGSVHYPWLPVSLLLWDRYPNLETIDRVDAPVLVIAGSADSIIPVEQSRRMFDAAPEPKRLLIIDGADHNDLALNGGEEMIDGIASFLEEHLG